MRQIIDRLFPGLMHRLAPTVMETLDQAEYAKRWVYPVPSELTEYYRTARRLCMAGIDLNDKEQLERVQRWRSESIHQALYESLRNDVTINVPTDWGNFLGRGAIQNGYYPTPDAEIYGSMILDFRPEQIVEVGSGFSTLIARKAVDHARLHTKIVIVDPEPRTSVGHVVDEVIEEPVERSGLRNRIDWSRKTLLFIDSSHICRARGDVPYLYCDVIPSLPGGVLVHVHDVFIPFDYPSNYDRYLYTEQYVLHALLTHSLRYKVALSTQYLSVAHTSEMQATFGSATAEHPTFAGASFWFEVR